jgi:hypothetical protein
MGTNYYVANNYCDCCKRYDEMHIGKSSGGWAFSFRGYKYPAAAEYADIDSWKKWKEFLKDKKIVDEYGDTIDYVDFVNLIETVKSPTFVNDMGRKNKTHNEEGRKEFPRWFDSSYDWDDEYGYSFSSREFS